MKCTNRILAVLLSACLLTGCGSQSFSFPYNPDYEVSSFRINHKASASMAKAFAEELCVAADQDIGTENSEVDMTNATAAGLFDLNRHEVLYAKNIHERLHPASLTKIMTALVALKYGNPDDMITVTSEAMITESGATLCGLDPGDKLTLNQALHALLISSANDAAAAIAIHVGGSIQGFADLMNQEALAIGATNSHFMNPHGLTQDNHYVTAYDMYLMFDAAIQYDLISEIIHMTSYETVYMNSAGGSKTYSTQTTNWYLNGHSKAPERITVIGGKTGTTNAAKSCLILLSKDTSGNPYISVILQAEQRDMLYEKMTDLLNVIN